MSVELGANKSDQLHAKEGTCFSHFRFTISRIRSNDKARKDTKTTRTDSQTAYRRVVMIVVPTVPFLDHWPPKRPNKAIYRFYHPILTLRALLPTKWHTAVYYAGIMLWGFRWLPVGTPHLIPFKDYKPWRKFESPIYPESSWHSSNFTAKISSSCLKNEALHLAFQVDQRKYQNLWILSL